MPLDEAIRRIVLGRPELKYYEAGMDLGLSDDPHESFKLFQERIAGEYEKAVEEFKLHVIDATLPITQQQRRFRELVRPLLNGCLKRPLESWLPHFGEFGISGTYLRHQSSSAGK